nr:hypothetical protein AUSP0033_00048 [uncultured phage]
MTEEFVTLETAKLLKEKGFDEPCSIAINIEDGRKYISNRTNSEMPRKVCTQPTQSIAQKWLRETKNIHICVYNCACGYGYEISKADNGTHIASSTYKGTNDGGEWNTYEETLEAGIKECLKLI